MNILDLVKDNKTLKIFAKSAVDLIVEEGTAEAIAIAYKFIEGNNSLLIVKNSLYNAQKLYQNLLSILDSQNLLFFPIDESLRLNALASSKDLLIERLYTLSLINKNKRIIITHTVALTRFLPSPKLFNSLIKQVKENQTIEALDMVNFLIESGYYKMSKIEHPLQFAIRGDIIDIFSPNYKNPIRIELFDNQIDSIRFFDLTSHKTIQKISEVDIIPASDLLFSQNEKNSFENKIVSLISSNKISEEMSNKLYFDIEMIRTNNTMSGHYQYYHLLKEDVASILDYFLGDIIVCNRLAIDNNYHLFEKESFEYQQELASVNQAIPGLKLHHDLSILTNRKTINLKKEKDSQTLQFLSTDVNHAQNLNDLLIVILNDYLKEGNTVIFSVNNQVQSLALENFLNYQKIPYHKEDKIILNSINIINLQINNGIHLLESKIVIFTPLEVFDLKQSSKRYHSRYKGVVSINDIDQLHIGDYVVHDEYGIGQFKGIITKQVSKVTKDYLKIDYRGEDVLYVPLEKFQLVKKYLSSDGIKPKLNRLSGQEWQKTKEKIKSRVNELADELIKLYSLRSQRIGIKYPPDDILQKEFENQFPYDLTLDQQTSIEQIKEEMEKETPMEMLLCGDVGFGKTEVAFRAAFKALAFGKQVIILAPTTILARQHYQRARQRFESFNFKIALISRMVPENIIKQAVEMINVNQINLIIGTHRLLNNEIVYPELGLIIIDEEQRFGVTHKEKIKLLRSNVDVLSLSATPIPRTLKLSLIGVRGFSQITTPPANRMPVQTYVLEKNDKIIKEVVERELARGGQVFYLYNNINKLPSIVDNLQNQIKNAKIALAHGQMDKEVMEDIMSRFYLGEIDVLVCTTIIESGLDIANANTIIIEEAQNLGLAQLYQIKGRVGRGDRLGYAYLFYTKSKVITEVAQKRLKSIQDFTELGSGYKIAIRDLSIRGAGDMLGAEQSGFIDRVGMDLYIRLLKEAIDQRKEETVEIDTKEDSIPLQINAYIPDNYAGDYVNKLDIYKMIMTTKTLLELEEVSTTIADLHGKVQELPIQLLLEKRKLEILSRSKYVDKIIDQPNYLEIILTSQFSTGDNIANILSDKLKELLNYLNLIYLRKQFHARISKDLPDFLNIAIQFLNIISTI